MGKRAVEEEFSSSSESGLSSVSSELSTNELLSSSSCSSSMGETSSESEGGSNSDSEGGSSSDSEIEFTFESFNMDKVDFHTVKQFLLNTFGKGVEGVKGGNCGQVDLSTLSHLITDVFSEYVGTTAKGAEDEDALAFISFLPLNLHDFHKDVKEADIECIKSMLALLVETSRKAKVNKKSRQAIEIALTETENTALIFHERYMNLPAQLSAPLYKQLFDDLIPAVDESRSFEPKYYLVLAPIYRELASTLDAEMSASSSKASNGGGGNRKKRGKTMGSSSKPNDSEGFESTTIDGHSEYQYYYDESLMMEELATAYWDFRIKTPHETADSRRAFGDRGIDPARRIFLLNAEDFKTFVLQCSSLL